LKIIVVNTPQLAKDWIEMPLPLYAQDKEYIRPLDKDVQEVFDPAKNKLHSNGLCERWLLQNTNGKYIGRIAVFINKKYRQPQATGGFGFFECENNQEAANFMLSEAVNWFKKNDMLAMDGPINFGERDRWWGCLLSGFTQPLYCMNYNLPYYASLLENFGCQILFNQLCFGMTEADNLSERVEKYGQYYLNHPDFEVRSIEKKYLDRYAKDFCTVYNASFAKHGEGKNMDIRVAQKMFASMKPVIDENICVFVYHKKEPIAAWLSLPDLNQYFKHCQGKFGLIEKLGFLWRKKTQASKKFIGLVYGVHPDWQGKGVDAAMMLHVQGYAIRTKQYNSFEMQWIGDFNPKMINLAKNLQAKEVRRLATFRYLFNREQEFVRMGKV
jgi:GNAT superfamily N-acetyltransferase